MPNDKFDKFAAEIKPFMALWKSVRVNVLAARFQQKWITLATHLQTSELQPDRNWTLLEPTSDILFFSGLLPIQELGQLVFSLINDGRLQLRAQGISECLYLSSTYAGVSRPQEAHVTWSDPWLQENTAQNHGNFGLRRPIIHMQGNNANERFVDFVDETLRKRFESELRLSEPAFDGLKDLRNACFRGLELETYSSCNVLILCQIPLELQYGDAGPEVIMPLHATTESVQVRGFFAPVGGSCFFDLQELQPIAPDMKTLSAKAPWPDHADRVNVVLLYDRQHITQLEVGRWLNAGSIRIATDTFFDSEHKVLKTALFILSSKGNQEFERAVARLLTLLGFPAVVYSSADDRRPDVAATLERKDKNPLILLGECTRERPTSKFSPLRERTRELAAMLQEQAEIIPLVFAQCDPVPSDYDSAAEHGIGLLGRPQLERLFRWLDSPVETEEIIEFLKSLLQSSDMPWVIGQPPRHES
jgi:hypothetical protein